MSGTTGQNPQTSSAAATALPRSTLLGRSGAEDAEHPFSRRTGAERVMARCAEIARISAMPGGIERTYLTPEHRQHNRLVGSWMREAGLTVRVDEAGTLHGRLAAQDPQAPVLYLGSHLDTVPDAGRYDGVLGVMVALEAAAWLARTEAGLPFHLEVLAFGDEEGVRFGATLLGSRALAGTWDPALLELEDATGTSLRQALEEFGLDPEAVGDAALDPARTVGYLEVHIEQGPLLQEAGRALGVVSSIAGARRFRFRVRGEAAHAGGTPYARRKDALVPAARAVLAAERIGVEYGAVLTVGRLEVPEGAVNVVPGRAEFSLDVRAPDDELRDAAYQALVAELAEACADRGVDWSVEETHRAPTVHCDPRLRAAVHRAVQQTGDPEPEVLYSKAGHDAMAVAASVPVAMLFTRCLDGISHQPGESVRPDDVGLAVRALETAVLDLAAQQAQQAQQAGGAPGPGKQADGTASPPGPIPSEEGSRP